MLHFERKQPFFIKLKKLLLRIIKYSDITGIFFQYKVSDCELKTVCWDSMKYRHVLLCERNENVGNEYKK